MINDYKQKWLITSVILLLIGSNQIMHKDQHSAIFGFFIIPSIMFLDFALKKISFKFSNIFSASIIILLLAISITSLLTSHKIENYPATIFLHNTLVGVLCIFLGVAATIIISSAFPNDFYILNCYNIIAYSITTLLIILTRIENYHEFIAFITTLLIFNSFIIYSYNLFNIDKIEGNNFLFLPLYLITLGMIIILIGYFIIPNFFIALSHHLALYLLILLFFLFIILVFTNYSPKNISLNFYHNLFYLCYVAVIITFLLRLFLDIHLNRNLTHIILILGVELVCCMIIFLFKISGIHNKILRFVLGLLITMIIFMKIIKDILIFANGYNLIKYNFYEFNNLIFSTNSIIKHSTHLLIGWLMVMIVYDLLYHEEVKYFKN